MITNPSVLLMLLEARAVERRLPRRPPPTRTGSDIRRLPRLALSTIGSMHRLLPVHGA